MLIGLPCAAIAVIAFFPETPIARQLRSILIDRPAAWLATLTTAKIVIWSLVLLGIYAAVIVAKEARDGIIVLQLLPEALAWLASMEVATYLEVITALWLMRAGVKLRAARQAAALAIASLRRLMLRAFRACLPRARGDVRRQHPKRPPKANSEDEDGPAFAFA